MRKKGASSLTQAGMIAALYTVLTLISASVGLSSGAVQLRLSEALYVLAVFTPAAIPGVFIGCILSNLITGCVIWDVIFGSLASLAGVIGTRAMRRKPFAALLPPIVMNTAVIPPVLVWAYGVETAWPLILLTVLLGEVLSAGVLGLGVFRILKKIWK